MRIVDGFCIREVLDEILVVPTGGTAQQLFSGIISLNEVGRFLFEALCEDKTEETLVAAVVKEYDVDEKTAADDVSEFLDSLRKNNLLVE